MLFIKIESELIEILAFITSICILIVNGVFFYNPSLLNLPYIDQSEDFKTTRTQASLSSTSSGIIRP